MNLSQNSSLKSFEITDSSHTNSTSVPNTQNIHSIDNIPMEEFSNLPIQEQNRYFDHNLELQYGNVRHNPSVKLSINPQNMNIMPITSDQQNYIFRHANTLNQSNSNLSNNNNNGDLTLYTHNTYGGSSIYYPTNNYTHNDSHNENTMIPHDSSNRDTNSNENISNLSRSYISSRNQISATAELESKISKWKERFKKNEFKHIPVSTHAIAEKPPGSQFRSPLWTYGVSIRTKSGSETKWYCLADDNCSENNKYYTTTKSNSKVIKHLIQAHGYVSQKNENKSHSIHRGLGNIVDNVHHHSLSTLIQSTVPSTNMSMTSMPLPISISGANSMNVSMDPMNSVNMTSQSSNNGGVKRKLESHEKDEEDNNSDDGEDEEEEESENENEEEEEEEEEVRNSIENLSEGILVHRQSHMKGKSHRNDHYGQNMERNILSSSSPSTSASTRKVSNNQPNQASGLFHILLSSSNAIESNLMQKESILSNMTKLECILTFQSIVSLDTYNRIDSSTNQNLYNLFYLHTTKDTISNSDHNNNNSSGSSGSSGSGSGSSAKKGYDSEKYKHIIGDLYSIKVLEIKNEIKSLKPTYHTTRFLYLSFDMIDLSDTMNMLCINLSYTNSMIGVRRNYHIGSKFYCPNISSSSLSLNMTPTVSSESMIAYIQSIFKEYGILESDICYCCSTGMVENNLSDIWNKVVDRIQTPWLSSISSLVYETIKEIFDPTRSSVMEELHKIFLSILKVCRFYRNSYPEDSNSIHFSESALSDSMDFLSSHLSSSNKSSCISYLSKYKNFVTVISNFERFYEKIYDRIHDKNLLNQILMDKITTNTFLPSLSNILQVIENLIQTLFSEVIPISVNISHILSNIIVKLNQTNMERMNNSNNDSSYEPSYSFDMSLYNLRLHISNTIHRNITILFYSHENNYKTRVKNNINDGMDGSMDDLSIGLYWNMSAALYPSMNRLKHIESFAYPSTDKSSAKSYVDAVRLKTWLKIKSIAVIQLICENIHQDKQRKQDKQINEDQFIDEKKRTDQNHIEKDRESNLIIESKSTEFESMQSIDSIQERSFSGVTISEEYEKLRQSINPMINTYVIGTSIILPTDNSSPRPNHSMHPRTASFSSDDTKSIDCNYSTDFIPVTDLYQRAQEEFESKLKTVLEITQNIDESYRFQEKIRENAIDHINYSLRMNCEQVVQTEILSYLSAYKDSQITDTNTMNPNMENVWKWWNEHREQYPCLVRIANTVFGQSLGIGKMCRLEQDGDRIIKLFRSLQERQNDVASFEMILFLFSNISSSNEILEMIEIVFNRNMNMNSKNMNKDSDQD